MNTVFDVAEWFLAHNQMTHKKLQKLCYYAQAWSYAICPEPICDAEFQAWVHGPVCRPLYDKYHGYGFDYIPMVDVTPTFSADEEYFLDSVWETYGDMSADSLEVLSHTETPWKKARLGLADNENSNRVIDPADMAEYYRSIYIGGDA